MNNIRANFLAVLVNVVHIEVLSDRTVKLNRNHRIFLAVDILRLDIDLRTVERSLAVRLDERKILLL